MGSYGDLFVRRARERFAALSHEPAWPGLEEAYWLAGEHDDDEARAKLDSTCVELSQRLGLTVEPRRCGCCDRELPGDDGPDGIECEKCAAEREERAREVHERQQREETRRAALSPEERAEEDRWSRAMLMGLIKRDVQ